MFLTRRVAGKLSVYPLDQWEVNFAKDMPQQFHTKGLRGERVWDARTFEDLNEPIIASIAFTKERGRLLCDLYAKGDFAGAKKLIRSVETVAIG